MNRTIENVLKYCFCYYKCYTNIDVSHEQPIINWKDTIPFVPPINSGIVIKVYDGDTITIASKLPYSKSEMYRFVVRLNGIDSPEIKSNNEEEKKIAKEARDYLTNKILHKSVVLKNITTEKYGRILADVYLGNTNINKLMIIERFAVEYNGGTKEPPKSWIRYRLTGET
jgi:endonuclease YncB( thermonuclease family)